MEERTIVEIDRDRCHGHAICFMLAAEVFDVDDEGRGTVIDRDPSGELEEQVRAAAGRCPEGAIRLRISGGAGPSEHEGGLS